MADHNNLNSPAADHKSDAAAQSDIETQSTMRPQVAEKRSLLAGLFPFLRSKQQNSLRADLTDALSDNEDSSAIFSPEEKAMLNNILRLREIRVDDIMIPRAEIDAIEFSTPLGELLELFESSGHSRMPVYVETLDDSRGMIHIRDVLNYITRMSRHEPQPDVAGKRVTPGTDTAAPNITSTAAAKRYDLSRIDLRTPICDLNLMRKVLFVPPSMLASGLMARMQASHIQMALVIDEYGGTDGLVSLEDVVEMVVGDIEDEHDDEEIMITRNPDGSFTVDARAELEELEKVIGPGFLIGDDSEDVDTISGLIFSVLGHVPIRGEQVEALPGYELHVLEAGPRRIHKVRIVPLKPNE